MGLGLKADAQRDIDQRSFGIAQQLLRALDPSLQDEIVWSHAGTCSELGSEMHAGKAGGGRHVCQGDATGQMSIDMVRNPLHSPVLKRCAAAARSGTLGRRYRRGDIALHRNEDKNPVEGQSDGGMLGQLN
jgi:hypothetical protein